MKHLIRGLFAIAFSQMPIMCFGQPFLEVTSAADSLPGVAFSSVAWGDYDQDNDLDILLAGGRPGAKPTNIYRNDGGIFTDIHANLNSVYFSSVAWGDYDNDNDLDLLISGAGLTAISKIYRNDAGLFVDINANLVGCGSSTVSWGDYDNDGDLDLFLAGMNTNYVAKIYRNDAGIFTDMNISFDVGGVSGMAWGDYDLDGDLDMVLTGNLSGISLSKIYRNTAGAFVDINANLWGVSASDVAWGDYDNDGDLDLLLAGADGTSQVAKIYRNDQGAFTDINAGLPGVSECSVDCGDIDNDGDLDIVISGLDGGAWITKIFSNQSGIFTDIGAGIAGQYFGEVAFGDYDNDGRLDLIVTGDDGTTQITKLYRNNLPSFNSPPTFPTLLTATQMSNNDVKFDWNPASDGQTMASGLSYRLWVGSSSGGFELSSPMADTATGQRYIPARGNIQGTEWVLKNALPGQTYFASVSAVDGGLVGGKPASPISIMLGNFSENVASSTMIVGAPNPTLGIMNLSLTGNYKALSYYVTTMEGQPISTLAGRTNDDFTLDLSGLPSGVYLLHLTRSDQKKEECLKLIKE